MRAALVSMLVALWVCLSPGRAHACGGTFCDGGTVTMPVDQTGETILFAIEDGFVEAHIQIEYDGDPTKFAWIVPLPADPEVSVGSAALFANLLGSTVPTYSVQRRLGSCFEDGSGEGLPYMFCCACLQEDSTGGGYGGEDTDGDYVDVLQRGLVGSFEFVVLTADSVETITSWLSGNGYEQNPAADPILQTYLDEGFVFLAVKLRAAADVDAIHPIVVRYPGSEPCIPIRLTRIAAVDDMQIRAFFLGARRVAPRNYRHVVINPPKIDWGMDLAVNYDEVVGAAIDEADGHAWVTEYAGPSDVVPDDGMTWSGWSAARFEDEAVTEVVGTLVEAGLFCYGNEYWDCVPHPMVLPLLLEHLPPPLGLDAQHFYACVECYLDRFDPSLWDPVAFANALEESVFGPAAHGKHLLASNPTLTRLYTMLSPGEMTVDPLFHEVPLPDLDTSDRSATLTRACEGPDWIELSDGSYIALAETPELDDVPAALRVELIQADGSILTIVDNTAATEQALAAWNRQFPLNRTGQGDLPPHAYRDDDEGCSAHGHHLRGAAGFCSLFGLLFFMRRRGRSDRGAGGRA